jgi:phosphatidylinositol alpha-1,6-mannosyltransferase
LRKRLLFLTLNTFSATGGIEKVCRAAAKALHEITHETTDEFSVLSMYDGTFDVDERYLPQHSFKGFNGNRFRFMAEALQKGKRADTIIISHVNLLLAGYLVKLLSPKTKLIVIAHGIEVWKEWSGWRKKMLKAVDLFLPVSHFTGEKLATVHLIDSSKIIVVNNCLDPYLEKKSDPGKEKNLRTKYGLSSTDFILLTLTRLKFSEQYKGYDKVVRALAGLKNSYPNIKYVISGKYDDEEKERLDKIISKENLEDRIIFTGFIAEEDLSAHFSLSDVYIMPSTGEGFGIVFIEALFYGKPVIAGNVDGSVDALAKGKFGQLIDPENINEIAAAIERSYNNLENFVINESEIMNRFGFETYKKRWREVIDKKNDERKSPRKTNLHYV